MIERKTRTCVCCGATYPYCPKCNEDKDKPHWYFTFCSDNCHDLYDVLTKYEWGQINATKAQERIEKLDLSKFHNFGESYKNTLHKIANSIPKPIVEPIVEIKDAKSEMVEMTENNGDEVVSKKAKKRVKVDIE